MVFFHDPFCSDQSGDPEHMLNGLGGHLRNQNGSVSASLEIGGLDWGFKPLVLVD